jgi:hypothetical protein
MLFLKKLLRKNFYLISKKSISSCFTFEAYKILIINMSSVMIKDAGMIDLSIDVLKLAAIAIVFEG